MCGAQFKREKKHSLNCIITHSIEKLSVIKTILKKILNIYVKLSDFQMGIFQRAILKFL